MTSISCHADGLWIFTVIIHWLYGGILQVKTLRPFRQPKLEPITFRLFEKDVSGPQGWVLLIGQQVERRSSCRGILIQGHGYSGKGSYSKT